MKEIFGAFTKAQSHFNKAVKDSTNPLYKSKYANIESVIDAISTSLGANGLAFVQTISSENSSWYLCTRLIHESGEYFDSPKVEIIIQDKNNPQRFGASLTYFRRYSLMAFFGIPDTDDDGNEASGKTDKELIEKLNKELKEKDVLLKSLKDKIAAIENKSKDKPVNVAPQSQEQAQAEANKTEPVTYKNFTFNKNSPPAFLGKRFDQIPFSDLYKFFEAMDFENTKAPNTGKTWILNLWKQYEANYK